MQPGSGVAFAGAGGLLYHSLTLPGVPPAGRVVHSESIAMVTAGEVGFPVQVTTVCSHLPALVAMRQPLIPPEDEE